MKVLVYGAGGLSEAIFRNFEGMGEVVYEVPRRECDVTLLKDVINTESRYRPDWVVNCAGLSDRLIGATSREVIEVNLQGAINVGTMAHALSIPCIQIASTAGISPGNHAWYGAAKAGVITYVRAMANRGADMWAVSPGRMDTPMRQRDFPHEDRQTRLDPMDVAAVCYDVFERMYSPGANVVIRKVGYDRIDIYEEVAVSLPSLLS